LLAVRAVGTSHASRSLRRSVLTVVLCSLAGCPIPIVFFMITIGHIYSHLDRL